MTSARGPVVPLGELVTRRRASLGLSYRAVAERSDGLVSHSTVHEIESGSRATPTDETIDGLALALDLPISQVRRSAGLPPPDIETPFVLPRRANRLSRKERGAVLAIVDALLEAKKR